MIRKYLAFLACLNLSFWSQAQKPDFDKLDRYFTALDQHHQFMGSLAVSQNGKIIYTRSIGFSDVESGTRADRNTRYRIGSISKTFTAVLVMKAVEEKKIQLDQPIKKWLPGIPQADQITIDQLLSHRSGIPDFTDNDDYLSWHTSPQSEAAMIARITKGGSDFPPGTKSAYSNANYVLLTYILEQLYRQPYATLLTRYITRPLGLQNTYFGGKIDPVRKEARSYQYTSRWIAVPETDMSIPLGAGAIVSTPTDLVQFSEALFSGKILKRESLERMKTIRDALGAGLFRQSFFDKQGYGHRGGIDKFTAVFTCFPNNRISFALTSNGTDYNNNEIALAALSAVFGRPFEIPDFSVYNVPAETLAGYTGVYTSTQVPFKLTITSDGKKLVAQASGQAPMPLEASAEYLFKVTKAGIVLAFQPGENTMLLKQGGREFRFTREQ